jgi:8-oxo-dGTP diphosphatase
VVLPKGHNCLEDSQEDMAMTDYVVGFLHDGKRVVLIEKNKPEWQAGKLNGVGGKIEVNEYMHEAMVREFKEETGLALPGWHFFLRIRSGEHNIFCFRKKVHRNVLRRAKTMEDEKIVIRKVKKLKKSEMIPNLSWIIPLAMYEHDRYRALEAYEV